MLRADQPVTLCILVNHTVTQRHTGRPQQLCIHAFDHPFHQHNTVKQQKYLFFTDPQLFGDLCFVFALQLTCKSNAVLSCHIAAACTHSRILHHRRKIIIHNNNVIDLPVFKVHFFQNLQLIVHDLFDQLFILGWFYLHGKDPLTHTQHTESDVLRCDQGVIVKQRNLYTASADIHDRSPLLNDLLEAFALGSDRLIIQEALFGITEYFYIQSCLFFYFLYLL